MKLPRNHLADETLVRVMFAANRVRARAKAPELEPEDDELVDLPPSLMPSAPLNMRRPDSSQDAPPSAAPTAPESVPPLDETGLDPATVLQGGDSFDALLKT